MASTLCREFAAWHPTPVMMWASSVTSSVSSGLPPKPTEWSHLCPCISQWVQPCRAGRSQVRACMVMGSLPGAQA